jgi:amino acid transporter
MPNGFSGVMAAVSGVFFAYIGFDAVSVLAEESKNPQRDLPRGMILSLVICTIVYVLLTLVLTGAVNYRAFDGVGDPLAFIFEKEHLNVGWMQFFVAIAAVVAMTSVLLVFQMGQPRIWMSMSRDGLLPPVFRNIHPKYKTPSFATVVTGLVVGLPILFTDKTFVLDFTSIATLFAFVLVCGGVLLIPRKEKIPGKFNMPYINGRYLFPGLVLLSVLLLSFFQPDYFSDKFNFSTEQRMEQIAVAIPESISDSASVTALLKSVAGNEGAEFSALQKTLEAPGPYAAKIDAARQLVSANDPAQSRTAKCSLIVFWLLLLVLAVLAFRNSYSLLPLLGVATCLYLLTGMSLSNWLWFAGWLALGLVIYFLYGYRNSRLAR